MGVNGTASAFGGPSASLGVYGNDWELGIYLRLGGSLGWMVGIAGEFGSADTAAFKDFSMSYDISTPVSGGSKIWNDDAYGWAYLTPGKFGATHTESGTFTAGISAPTPEEKAATSIKLESDIRNLNSLNGQLNFINKLSNPY